MITIPSQKNSTNAQSQTRAIDLRCEYLHNPLGVDVREPRLTWLMESAESGQKQTAYRIIVASTKEMLSSGAPDLWDSGKIASDQSAHVPYAGKPLASGLRCFWQVQIWDKDGRPTEFSEPAWWEMGLLEPADWKASWITWPGGKDDKNSPLFRRGFQASKPVSRARLYICGIGLYEAYVNGELVSTPLARQESVLPERVFYDTYDVTTLLNKGGNAIGVWLGAGWFGQPNHMMDEKVVLSIAREHKYMLIAQLALQYTDDTTEWVVSDDRWKTAPSGLEPVSYLGFYYFFSGESSDGESRRAHLEWNTAAFDDAAWEPARKIEPPTQRLSANMIEPNRIVETLNPVSAQPIAAQAAWLEDYLPAIWERDLGSSARMIFERSDCRFAKLPSAPFLGGVEYDFGKKVSGWARIKVTGSKGDYVSILGLDTYRLSGEPNEELCLRSVHRVFRHLPVLFFGQGKAPRIIEIQALAIQNDIRPVGRFECSDPALTRIHYVSARTFATQILRGVPMEGAREHVGTSFMQNYEQSFYGLAMGAFYTKWLTDYRDLQGPDGNSTTTGAPLHWPVVGFLGSLCSLSRLSWLMYLYYGDPDILKATYPAMKRFLEFCFRQEGQFSWQPQGGDGEFYTIWNRPGDEGVPDLKKDGRLYHDAAVGDLVDTLVLIDTLDMSLAIATVLNKPEDTQQFALWRDRLVKKANRPGNFNRNRGMYGAQPGYINGDMGCQAMALTLDIVPEEIRKKAAAWLIHDITVNRKGHLGTGLLGSYYLLKSLIALNRPDVAYTAIRHPTPPSWVTADRLGDSMLAEFWDVYPKSGHGHAETHLCCVGFWFYQSLGGIRPDPTAPGFKCITIRPQIVRALTWAKAEYDSIRGTIRSAWTLDGERVKMSVTIPANAAAVVYVPAKDKQSVIAPENGAARFVRMEEDAAVFETGSGVHVFESTLPPIRIPASITIAPDILSPFKRKWRVSDPIETATLNLDKPLKLNWKPATAMRVDEQGELLNFLELHGKCGGVVFAEGEIEAPAAMKTLLLLGPDGPCKVWLDGALVGETYRSTGPCEPDTVQFAAPLTKGRHTITVLFDRRGGCAWGFRLRIKRLVADETEQELPVMDL